MSSKKPTESGSQQKTLEKFGFSSQTPSASPAATPTKSTKRKLLTKTPTKSPSSNKSLDSSVYAPTDVESDSQIPKATYDPEKQYEHFKAIELQALSQKSQSTHTKSPKKPTIDVHKLVNKEKSVSPEKLQAKAFSQYKRQREPPKPTVPPILDHSTIIDTSFASTKLKSPQKIRLTDESWLQNKYDTDFKSGQWITALSKENLLGKEHKIEWSIGKIKYFEDPLSEINANVIVMIRAIENFNSDYRVILKDPTDDIEAQVSSDVRLKHRLMEGDVLILRGVKVFGIDRILNVVEKNVVQVISRVDHQLVPEINDSDRFLNSYGYIAHNFARPVDREKKRPKFHYQRSVSDSIVVKKEETVMKMPMTRARSDPEAELTRLRAKYLHNKEEEEEEEEEVEEQVEESDNSP